jgi:hypothetical protein
MSKRCLPFAAAVEDAGGQRMGVGGIFAFGQSLFGEQLRLFERADAEQMARLGSFVGLEGSAFRVPLGHRWKLLLSPHNPIGAGAPRK